MRIFYLYLSLIIAESGCTPLWYHTMFEWKISKTHCTYRLSVPTGYLYLRAICIYRLSVSTGYL